jgi:hypothetical protein
MQGGKEHSSTLAYGPINPEGHFGVPPRVRGVGNSYCRGFGIPSTGPEAQMAYLAAVCTCALVSASVRHNTGLDDG